MSSTTTPRGQDARKWGKHTSPRGVCRWHPQEGVVTAVTIPGGGPAPPSQGQSSSLQHTRVSGPDRRVPRLSLEAALTTPGMSHRPLRMEGQGRRCPSETWPRAPGREGEAPESFRAAGPRPRAAQPTLRGRTGSVVPFSLLGCHLQGPGLVLIHTRSPARRPRPDGGRVCVCVCVCVTHACSL